MEIKRDKYLNQLKDYAWDGQIKIITGIRRCGKSYLLRTLYKNYLIESGVNTNNIICVELDLAKDIRYRNPLELASYIRNRLDGKKDPFYLFIDEIQMSDIVTNPYNEKGKPITFYDTLNDLNSIDNLDVYVTGSNSRMLSSDILTEFRGRYDEIRLHPLSFSEYYNAIGGSKEAAFDNYAFYGGMPLILSRPDDEAKMSYLKSLFSEVYIKDIIERKHITREDILSDILDFLSSAIGSLTNPTKIANTINSIKKLNAEDHVSPNTIKSYIGHLEDAFLFTECKRYDVKGKSYFAYPNKYYCEDIGLRNARIGFRQQELNHIMENIIYNELIIRRANVDIGIVASYEMTERDEHKNLQREIDFIASKGNRKIYVQSVFAIETDAKKTSETKSLSLIRDSFPKLLIRYDMRKRWYDDNGILNISVIDFLLDDSLF